MQHVQKLSKVSLTTVALNYDTHHPRLPSMHQLHVHLALRFNLCKLLLDIVEDELGRLGGGHVRDETDGEFSCDRYQMAMRLSEAVS